MRRLSWPSSLIKPSWCLLDETKYPEKRIPKKNTRIYRRMRYGVNQYNGTDVKNAWNERTVDTIPYVSISLYPYIFISSTKTGSQYFLTSIYRLQDINSIFCRILFYFHGNHRFCIQRWIFWAKFWVKFFPHPPRCHQCYFSLFLQCLLFSVTRYVCLQ